MLPEVLGCRLAKKSSEPSRGPGGAASKAGSPVHWTRAPSAEWRPVSPHIEVPTRAMTCRSSQPQQQSPRTAVAGSLPTSNSHFPSDKLRESEIDLNATSSQARCED